jgi:hypothetical protein
MGWSVDILGVRRIPLTGLAMSTQVSGLDDSRTLFVPATGRETIAALLARSRRDAVPLRRTFVQQGTPRQPVPGPLSEFVRRHDDRALELYLLFRAVASAPPWNVDASTRLWARTLDLGATRSAVSAVSRAWRRLEVYRLVKRQRARGQLSIVALLDDGSGGPYAHPSAQGRREPYFKLPFAYWANEEAWHRRLNLAETAMLLIALSLADDFVLPYRMARRWYGVSPDTAERGLRGLQDRGLLQSEIAYKSAPLAPAGYAEERRYTLLPPFGPRGRRSSSSRTRSDGDLLPQPMLSRTDVGSTSDV